jgi:predicted MFS family arabinose efflux permease
MEAKSDPAEAPSAIRSYYVLAVLAFVYMFSTVDRTMISVLAEPIKREFGLSDSQLGLLTGLAFAISYSIAGIPLGMLADRYRRTRLLALLVSVWSALTFVSGLATSAFTLGLARIGVGASESGASPASMSLITDYFAKERRGLALALFYMSTPIGVALSFSLGGMVAAAHGWRAAFLFAGGPGLLLALLILLTIREPQRGRYDSGKPAAVGERPSLLDAAKTLVTLRPLLFLLLGAVAVVVAQAGIGAFASPFLIRVHGLNVEQAGQAIGAIKGPTGIVGLLAGGLMADWLARRSPEAGPRLVGLLMLLAAPFAAAAMLLTNWTLVVLCIGSFNFLNYTYYGAVFATYMTLAPVQMRGTLAAMFAVSMTMIGYGLGPPLAGTASDVLAALHVADPIRWALVITGSFFAVGGVLFLAAARSIRRMNDEGTGPDLARPIDVATA